MFKKANYSSDWSAQGAPVVVVDLGDDCPASYTQESLVKIVETIRKRRMKYPTEAEYKAALGVFEGALAYLRTEMEVERRR